jgi:hypothetical protein
MMVMPVMFFNCVVAVQYGGPSKLAPTDRATQAFPSCGLDPVCFCCSDWRCAKPDAPHSIDATRIVDAL